MEERDLLRFDRRRIENERYWSRLGGMPSVNGLSILDVGCGQGGMCIELALAGAARVVGVDIEPRVVTFARDMLASSYSELAPRVTFEFANLADYDPAPQFDMILSKDSFEHIADIPGMLTEMKRRLRPGGKIVIGFGPLYNSINGAHAERLLIPWGHRILPRKLFLAYTAWDRRHPMNSLDDLHLNRHSFKEFRRMFAATGLDVEYFATNVGTHPLTRLFRVLAAFPPLRESCTANLYCILRKPT